MFIRVFHLTMRWGVLTRCFWQQFKRLDFAFAATLLFAPLLRDGPATTNSVMRINIREYLGRANFMPRFEDSTLACSTILGVAEENCVSGIKIHLYVGRGSVRSLSLTYGEQ